MASVFARKVAPLLPALHELEGRALDEALAAFVPCALGPGEVLMDPEDKDHPVLMVVEGELSVNTSGRPPLRLATLGPGDVIGGSPLHGTGAPPARVTTESICHVLVLEHEGAAWLRSMQHPLMDALQRAALRTTALALRGAAVRLANVARLPNEPVSTTAPSLLSKLTGRLGLPRGAAPRPEPLLSRSPVFEGVDAVANGWLADRMVAVPLANRQALQVERCALTGAWMVAEGEVELHRDITPHSSELLETLGPGAIVGLPGLIDGGPAPLTAVARGRSWVYQLSPKHAESLLYDPEAGPLRRAMLTTLDERLRQASIGLTEVALMARRGGLEDLRMLRATAAALWSTRGA